MTEGVKRALDATRKERMAWLLSDVIAGPGRTRRCFFLLWFCGVLIAVRAPQLATRRRGYEYWPRSQETRDAEPQAVGGNRAMYTPVLYVDGRMPTWLGTQWA